MKRPNDRVELRGPEDLESGLDEARARAILILIKIANKGTMRTQLVFKALADPTRREILKQLQRQSMTAGELAEVFDMTKGTLSHHFKILKEAELVRSEKRAQQRVYSINTTVFEDVAATLFELFGAHLAAAPGAAARRRQA